MVKPSSSHIAVAEKSESMLVQSTCSSDGAPRNRSKLGASSTDTSRSAFGYGMGRMRYACSTP
jgi:hypothetical protein